MIFQKVSSLVLIPVLFVSFFASFFLASPVRAQEENADLMCPVQGSFSVRSDLVGKNITTEDSLIGEITVENGTDYFLPGIKVGVGIFENEVSLAPSYWTVLPNVIDLLPNTRALIEANLDLSALPKGEYLVKLFINQGDNLAVFGAALRDTNTNQTFTINKITPKSSGIELTAALNGTAVAANNPLAVGEEFLLTVEAKNNGLLPVVNSTITTVLTQGEVSLASAVIKKTEDNLKLIPNGLQTTKLSNGALTDGDYTAYTLIDTENILQAVETIKFKVGEGEGTKSWPYISLVGISDYPTSAETEIVACINYLGLGAEARQIHSTLGVMFSGQVGEQEIFSSKVTNLDGGTAMYFNSKLGVIAQDATIITSLLEDTTGQLLYAGSEPAEVDVRPEDYFSTTQSIVITLSCNGVNGCESHNESIGVNDYSKTTHREPFWFYAGVVIAALLLMYLMLRRLHPHDNNLNNKLSDSELQ